MRKLYAYNAKKDYPGMEKMIFLYLSVHVELRDDEFFLVDLSSKYGSLINSENMTFELEGKCPSIQIGNTLVEFTINPGN